MPKTNPHTFNYWMVGESGPVRKVSVDELPFGYQSEYVMMFNFIRDRGWTKEGKKWKNPRTGTLVRRIRDAYWAEKYQDMINDK